VCRKSCRRLCSSIIVSKSWNVSRPLIGTIRPLTVKRSTRRLTSFSRSRKSSGFGVTFARSWRKTGQLLVMSRTSSGSER
jgi:hypothetical protein